MSQVSKQEDIDYSFFSGGLLQRLLAKAGPAWTGVRGIRTRTIWLIVLTYLVLLVLSALQGVAFGPGLTVPFLLDISEACRFLIVGPLLILSEAIVDPWLVQVIRHARDSLIPADDVAKYDRIIGTTIRLRDSVIAEILLLVGVFAWQWADLHVAQAAGALSWQQLPSTNSPTYAWLWYAYLAKPLIRFLWLRWLWRYFAWSLFLLRLSSLNLKIRPNHPDYNGGLAFISVGHSRFAVLAFAFGAQVASMFGVQILFQHQTLLSFKAELIGIVVLILLIFLIPLLAFTGKLINAKRIGLFEYGALADQYTSAFRARWIGSGKGDAPVLGTNDIQALADVRKNYAAVSAMSCCLISKSSLMTFVVAPLLPFTPLLLTVYPFDELVNRVLKAVM